MSRPQPAAKLVRPLAETTAPGRPYVAAIELDDPCLGESLTIRVALQRADSGSPAELNAAAELTTDGPSVEVVIDVAELADGDYRGTVSLGRADRSQTWPIAFHRLPAPKPAPFPFGLYAVPFPEDDDECRAMLAQFADMGINLISDHMAEITPTMARQFDLAARQEIRFMPSCGPHRRPGHGAKTAWTEAEAAVFPPGAPQARRLHPCLNRPALRERAARDLVEMLATYAKHPGFSGKVYYGDDLFLWAQSQQGEVWLSCYCDACRQGFAAACGREPPTDTASRSGIVADDDPWLAWMRYRSAAGYGGFVSRLESARQQAAPDVELGLCHGWPDNPFTSVATGIYPSLSETTNVMSSYCYPFLRSPAQDFIAHYELGRMGNREKDVWMLGLLAADRTAAPTWQVYQNYWNMLAAGYRLITFFSWWDVAGVNRGGDAKQIARMAESVAALARCGRHAQWVLPIAAHWQRPTARHAILHAFTTEAFDIRPINRNHQHTKEVCRLYRLALREGVELEVICEEEIHAGILDRFETVCLHDVRALAGATAVRLADFVKRGKTVLVDPDYLYADGWHPAAKVTIAGARELAPESMIAHLRDRVPPALDVSSPDVTARRFRCGDVTYLVFVNNYADRYWGQSYAYGDPDENYRKAELVQDRAVETTVTFADPHMHLFDLETGQPLGTSRETLALVLGPSWGRALAALPAAAAELVLEMPEAARQGEQVQCRLHFADRAGATIDGAFAVKVVVTKPSGCRSGYSTTFSIAPGQQQFALPLGSNDETGTWQMQFEGGFPRHIVTRELQVARHTAPAAWLGVKAAGTAQSR